METILSAFIFELSGLVKTCIQAITPEPYGIYTRNFADELSLLMWLS